MGISFSKKKRCINCVFLSKYILRGKDIVDDIEREIIERDINKNSEWGNEQYSLACYHEFWSEGNIPHLGLYHTICVKDRSNCPSYLEYDSDYKTFPSAEKTLEEKIERKKTRSGYLFRIFLTLLATSIALIGGIFSEELKEFFIHLYDKIVQYFE